MVAAKCCALLPLLLVHAFSTSTPQQQADALHQHMRQLLKAVNPLINADQLIEAAAETNHLYHTESIVTDFRILEMVATALGNSPNQTHTDIAFDYYDQLLEGHWREWNDEPERVQQISYNAGTLMMKAGPVDKAVVHLERAHAMIQPVQPRAELRGWIHRNMAGVYLSMGRHDDAIASLEQADTHYLQHTPYVIEQYRTLLAGVRAEGCRRDHVREIVLEAFVLTARSKAQLPVLVMEFGVFQGWSSYLLGEAVLETLGEESNVVVDGFDSFIGLPEAWEGTMDAKHMYTQEGLLPPGQPDNVRFHSGWFNSSLSRFLEDVAADTPVAALHMDADLYSSTMDVLHLLATRLPVGGIVSFDNYYIFIPIDKKMWDQHEARAWTEIMDMYGIESEAISFMDQRVNFRVTKNPQFGLVAPVRVDESEAPADGEVDSETHTEL